MNRTATSVASGVFISLSAFGQWQLMDNFGAYSDGQIFLNAEDVGWHATTTNDTDEHWILTGPYENGFTSWYRRVFLQVGITKFKAFQQTGLPAQHQVYL